MLTISPNLTSSAGNAARTVRRRRAFTRAEYPAQPLPPYCRTGRVYRSSSLGSVAPVVGRLGIADVAPVVGALTTGEFPARAVVGESVPIAATVFREGHDAVGADVVLRDPSGGKAGADPDGARRARHRPLARDRRLRPARAVDVRDRGVQRPVRDLAPRDHGQGRRRPGRDRAGNDLETGARLFARLAKALPKSMRGRARAGARRGDRAARRRPRLARAGSRRPSRPRCRRSSTSTRCANWSPARPATRSCVDRQRALFGSWYEFFPRSIGAVLDGSPTRRPARCGTARFKDATEHLDYVAAMGFDVVYLPPIHPIGEVNRKGPNNTLDPGRVGRRLALGDRLERRRPRRHPPRPRHDGRLRRFVRRANAARAWRSRSTSPCSPRPTTRG